MFSAVNKFFYGNYGNLSLTLLPRPYLCRPIRLRRTDGKNVMPPPSVIGGAVKTSHHGDHVPTLAETSCACGVFDSFSGRIFSARPGFASVRGR